MIGWKDGKRRIEGNEGAGYVHILLVPTLSDMIGN